MVGLDEHYFGHVFAVGIASQKLCEVVLTGLVHFRVDVVPEADGPITAAGYELCEALGLGCQLKRIGFGADANGETVRDELDVMDGPSMG